MQEGIYIYKKEVDWSVLQQGFTIPLSIQVLFQKLIANSLPRGTSRDVKILIDGEIFEAKLVNQKFDETKYPNHKDIIQFRYKPQSAIAQKMQAIFRETYNHCIGFKNNPLNRKKRVPIPEDKKEYFVLFSTQFEDTFLCDYMTFKESKATKNQLYDIDENEYELMINYKKKDLNARIEERLQLVKTRKIDRSICDSLKFLYNFQCQITGENFSEKHGVSVVEAHHIDYFTKSQNNDTDNIVIISPNYHRLIHKLDPVFDKDEKAFIFPNGLKEKLSINLHL